MWHHPAAQTARHLGQGSWLLYIILSSRSVLSSQSAYSRRGTEDVAKPKLVLDFNLARTCCSRRVVNSNRDRRRCRKILRRRRINRTKWLLVRRWQTKAKASPISCSSMSASASTCSTGPIGSRLDRRIILQTLFSSEPPNNF